MALRRNSIVPCLQDDGVGNVFWRITVGYPTTPGRGGVRKTARITIMYPRDAADWRHWLNRGRSVKCERSC